MNEKDNSRNDASDASHRSEQKWLFVELCDLSEVHTEAVRIVARFFNLQSSFPSLNLVDYIISGRH